MLFDLGSAVNSAKLKNLIPAYTLNWDTLYESYVLPSNYRIKTEDTFKRAFGLQHVVEKCKVQLHYIMERLVYIILYMYYIEVVNMFSNQIISWFNV